ncbi:MAG: hypothetical protein AAGG68_21875 [Bacteroidota bacterium]
MNSKNHIKELLEKYFEGETSIAEEQQLKAYFNGEQIAEELLPYQDLFQYFKIAKEVNFDKKISLSKSAKVSKLTPRNKTFTWLSVAASIALVIGLWFFYPSETTSDQVAEIDWSQYEPDDPEEALEYTIAAMKLLSGKLNGGAKKAAKELDRMADIEEVILKQKIR